MDLSFSWFVWSSGDSWNELLGAEELLSSRSGSVGRNVSKHDVDDRTYVSSVGSQGKSVGTEN